MFKFIASLFGRGRRTRQAGAKSTEGAPYKTEAPTVTRSSGSTVSMLLDSDNLRPGGARRGSEMKPNPVGVGRSALAAYNEQSRTTRLFQEEEEERRRRLWANDLTNPLNPMGLTSPISPLNPSNELFSASSASSSYESAPTPESSPPTLDCGSSSTPDFSSSSSSFDSSSSIDYGNSCSSSDWS